MNKKKIARKLMQNKNGEWLKKDSPYTIYDNPAWNERKKAIAERVKRKHDKTK